MTEMFTIDDFMQRYDDKLKRGYTGNTVWVTPTEFHELCTQDSRIFDTYKIYGIVVLVDYLQEVGTA